MVVLVPEPWKNHPIFPRDGTLLLFDSLKRDIKHQVQGEDVKHQVQGEGREGLEHKCGMEV